MQCSNCSFDTHEDLIRGAFWTSKGFVVIENIPARLCEGCGEQFFTEETTQQIQQVLKHPPMKTQRQTQVIVYSLSKSRVANRNHTPQVPDQPYTSFFESSPHQARLAAEPAIIIQGDPESLLCKYCKSETVESCVKSVFWINGSWVAVENIPARVCRRCEEQFYDEETIDIIVSLENSRSVQGTTRRVVVVPVFSFADADKCHG